MPQSRHEGMVTLANPAREHYHFHVPPSPMLCPSCKAENEPSAENCFRCGKGLFVLTEGCLLASRYKVVSPLGKGGMGMVYKAHDLELDEFVAIKVLRPEAATSPGMTKRFRSEIKLARRV